MNEPVSMLDLGIYRMQRFAYERWSPELRDALENAGFQFHSPLGLNGIEVDYVWGKDWIRFGVGVQGEATELACKKILEISKTVIFGPGFPSPLTEQEQQIQELQSRKSEMTKRELEGLAKLEIELEVRKIKERYGPEYYKEERELTARLYAERYFSHSGYGTSNQPKEWKEQIVNMMVIRIYIEDRGSGKSRICFGKISSEEMGMVVNPGRETYYEY